MPGFLTRDQELITRKVTPGTPRLALTETPERRCEMDDECERKKEKERAVKSQSAWEIRGDDERERELRKKREAQVHINSKRWQTARDADPNSNREADIEVQVNTTTKFGWIWMSPQSERAGKQQLSQTKQSYIKYLVDPWKTKRTEPGSGHIDVCISVCRHTDENASGQRGALPFALNEVENSPSPSSSHSPEFNLHSTCLPAS
ncbi:hypothetical protein GBF38_001428 [Nibea albiflora]|uniref:Uncharacterized protein n=1 Tax=Nibea albiflora TaxID=240163 RepID=A0ACB7ETI4_NIBAL|nr:hypothetical protein GBF38_001428 [Nibea albiflora]